MSNLQYFYRNYHCIAKLSKDSDCIWWHDAGGGPLQSKTGESVYGSRYGEIHLTWRKNPVESEKDGCTCQGCGVVYTEDLIVPDDWWEKIKPDGKAEGAGLLCPTCIMKRLVEKGWSVGHVVRSIEHIETADKMAEALEAVMELIEPTWPVEIDIMKSTQSVLKSYRRQKECS